jgi:hypothetical protein
MPSDLSTATAVLLQQRRELEAGVACWMARLPLRQGLGSPTEVLDSVAGALWLELRHAAADGRSVRQCLRRVLYTEFERPWRRQPLSLSLPVARAQAPRLPEWELDLPPHLLPWAMSYLYGGGPEGRLDRGVELCGSRNHTRQRNSALFNALEGGRFRRDLQRRAARIAAAVAVDGPLPVHRREARRVLCVLKMLEPTAEWTALRATLKAVGDGDA